MGRLLVGVTGGISAYKLVETVRLAIKSGHAVRVIQTEASARFVGPASFSGITGAPVLCDEFEPDPLRGAYPGDPPAERAPITHLALVERADVYLIAPASANTIAKLAHGQADNLVTASALAATCPVLVAPAMNNRMFSNPATQANLTLLEQRGMIVVGPGEGELASHGEHGIGRLAEPAELLVACEASLGGAPGPDGLWLGRRVLVTAGGTREPIDSVRYIGNRSSGRMGYALAERAAARGAVVTVVAANVSLTAPPGVRVVQVQTASELTAACERAFETADILLMAAAVADFRPRHPAGAKLEKDAGVPALELEATEDVLSALAARRRPEQVLIGFAAEHGEPGLARGRSKLQRKSLDAIVINDISAPGIGFDATDNQVTIVTVDGTERRLEKADKRQIADGVLEAVQMLVERKESDHRAARADADRAARV